MRPLAPIVTELRLTGGGAIVVGLGGLAAAVARRSGEPVRVLVPFLVVALVVGAATTIVGAAWLRRAVPGAPPAPAGATLEPEARTRRRCLAGAVIIAVLVAAAVVVSPGLAAILAGAAAGSGATDLRTASWIGREAHERGVEVLRESHPSPFAGLRRAVYTRP